MSMAEIKPRPMLLTVAQAAERLAVRPSTIRSWLSKGLLPKTKCGRCTRVATDAIDAFIVANTTPSAQSLAPSPSRPFDPEITDSAMKTELRRVHIGERLPLDAPEKLVAENTVLALGDSNGR